MTDQSSDDNFVIEIQHVTYTHWNRSEPTLVDVSLKIPRGKLTALVGPGGSGKSTLCDLLNGVIPHLNSGKYVGDTFIDGVNTRALKVADISTRVGRVFQDPEAMLATLYVDDEIAFGPENLRVDPEVIRSRVDQYLEETDLALHRHHLVWQLSGGQIQKLGLASILATDPAVIVLDEPTSNLDPDATAGCMIWS